MSAVQSIATPAGETAAFRNAMRHLAGAVSVITTGRGDQRTGFTATSVTSLSMHPPALLVCLNRQSSVAPRLIEHGAFCINVLADDQQNIAEHFSGRDGSRGADRYRDAEWQEMPSGALGLVGSLARIDCELEESIDRHSHTILISRPTSIALHPTAEPLLYWLGAYRQLTNPGRMPPQT